MSDVLLGMFLLAGWLLMGLLAVGILRRDLWEETWTALLNCTIWPVGFVLYPIGRYRQWRRERDRQDRITAKVNAGEYEASYAREKLKWNG